MNRLGVHWIPAHNRPKDYEYMKRLVPSVVKIINPDVAQVAAVYAINPNATIILRDHALSEQKSDMNSKPTETGKRHAREWRDKIDLMYKQADNRGIKMPNRNQLIVLGINEPSVWTHLAQTIEYTAAFLNDLTSYGIRGGALNLSVGWPANTGTDTPPNWNPYAKLEKIIQRGNHVLMLHEYWGKDGPNGMWGWLAGRFTACPWNVNIIIGEAGIDQYVMGDVSGHMGWAHFLSPEEYTEQLYQYIGRASLDNRFMAATIFTTDYGSRDWASFDTKPAMEEILNRNWVIARTQQEIKIHLPFIGNYNVTQEFGENPDMYKPFNGHTGIDFALPMHTDVNSVDDGIVAESFALPNLGKYIKIKHWWGESVYAHLSNRLVRQNDTVISGQPIGESGNSGRSTGPHLHFGMRVNPYDRADGWDGYTDPSIYLPLVSVPPMPPDDKVINIEINEVTTLIINNTYRIKIAP